jgi:hypothetical protein
MTRFLPVNVGRDIQSRHRPGSGRSEHATLCPSGPGGWVATPGNDTDGGAAEASATNVEPLFIRDYFRRWFARFKLGRSLSGFERPAL